MGILEQILLLVQEQKQQIEALTLEIETLRNVVKPPADELIERSEAAKLMRISIRTLDSRKDLPRIKDGNRVLYSRKEINEYLSRRTS